MKFSQNMKSRLLLLLVAGLLVITIAVLILSISAFVLSAVHSFSRHETLLGVCYSITAAGLAWQAAWRFRISRTRRDSGTDSRTV